MQKYWHLFNFSSFIQIDNFIAVLHCGPLHTSKESFNWESQYRLILATSTPVTYSLYSTRCLMLWLCMQSWAWANLPIHPLPQHPPYRSTLLSQPEKWSLASCKECAHGSTWATRALCFSSYMRSMHTLSPPPSVQSLWYGAALVVEHAHDNVIVPHSVMMPHSMMACMPWGGEHPQYVPDLYHLHSWKVFIKVCLAILC